MAMRDPEGRPSRAVLVVLVLACLTVITLDAGTSSHSPLNPVRQAVGNLMGPAETAAATAVRPFQQLGSLVHSNSGLRADVVRLEAQNAQLRSRLAGIPMDKQRLAELAGLTRTAKQTGYSIVAAQVVAMGPAQAFSRTVTIDAGTSSGVRADMTVVNAAGLVGRVVDATRSSATVLLITDPTSVVGARLGSNLEIGFVRGQGTEPLRLSLVDSTAVATRGDEVVTWGSKGGVPYVAGIPIGQVTALYSSPRQLSTSAVISPYVDFTALDLVGVIVPRGTQGDRPVITANGVSR